MIAIVRMRLTTLLLLVLVLGLMTGLLIQWRREIEIRRRLATYRNPAQEALINVLESPIALDWPDGTSLGELLKLVRVKTTGLPKLKTGMPIYIDPNGLQEAEKTPDSPVGGQPPDSTLSLSQKLQHALDPLGLKCMLRSGFLMIDAKQSADEPILDPKDPYLLYRDILD
jgi:hypothetical protein